MGTVLKDNSCNKPLFIKLSGKKKFNIFHLSHPHHNKKAVPHYAQVDFSSDQHAACMTDHTH
jgi:hypothetical protein